MKSMVSAETVTMQKRWQQYLEKHLHDITNKLFLYLQEINENF